ncbi:MAG: hypothetical protein M1570_18610 [Chloroflexi bacterium]|nr:hypothetical protein [Chloroflexota bacterium]
MAEPGHEPTNLVHGAWSFLNSGRLPADKEGLDVRIADELLRMAGGDERFRPMATLCARRIVFLQLITEHVERESMEHPGKVPPSLDKVNSFFEGCRRDLVEMGLTPMAAMHLLKAGRDGGDMSEANEIIEQYRSKDASDS